MKALLVGLMVTVFVLVGVASAEQKVTLDEAKAMVAKAADYYKANGKDKLIAEVNKGANGPFYKKETDIFPFVHDMKGVLLAHPNNKIVGINFMETKDPAGKFFVKEMVEVAKGKGSGVTEYSWVHPVTKKVVAKIGYLQKVDNDTFIACGIYK